MSALTGSLPWLLTCRGEEQTFLHCDHWVPSCCDDALRHTVLPTADRDTSQRPVDCTLPLCRCSAAQFMKKKQEQVLRKTLEAERIARLAEQSRWTDANADDGMYVLSLHRLHDRRAVRSQCFAGIPHWVNPHQRNGHLKPDIILSQNGPVTPAPWQFAGRVLRFRGGGRLSV